MCVTYIFLDMIENRMEIFLDDFLVFVSTYDQCLKTLDRVLQRCENSNLVLKWEKYYFMVQEGIVLGRIVSSKGLQVDRGKIEVIEKLPLPTTVKGVSSFLGHTRFYRRFIKGFPEIAKPLCKLLEKDVVFKFDEACLQTFEELKAKIKFTPILATLDWSLPLAQF